MPKYTFRFLLPAVLLAGGLSAFAAPEPPAAGLTLDSSRHIAYLSGSDEALPLFSPTAPLTRAHAAQMLHSLLTTPAEITISYADIPSGAWYEQAAREMGSLGVMQAGETDFCPNEALTRAEFVRCLSYFFPLRSDAEPFSDVPETHPDAAAILSAKACGWVQGDGGFRPDDPISRIEAVVILNRALGRVPDLDYISRSAPVFYRDVTPANWYYYEVMEASVPHEYHHLGGAERWTSHTAQATPPTEGFYLIDGYLYYYDSARKDILRNESRELLSFSASGQCFAAKTRLHQKMVDFVTERGQARVTLTEMEHLLAEAAAEMDAWNLILINGSNPLPEDFTIPGLTALDNGYQIDSRVYPALQTMLADARAAGYSPMVCSAYRTWDKQSYLHQNRMGPYLRKGYSREKASEAAAFWVARPGTSEHQAGLAADIVDSAYPVLNKSQERRPVQKWLMEHCAEYGFILRYPTTKSSLTGVGYEPWHYRYVGTEAAQEIMSRGICLEEYLSE